MATNGTDIGTLGMDEEIFRMSKGAAAPPAGSPDRVEARKRAVEHPGSDAESFPADDAFALAPLVNRIAFSMAKGLTVALKELEEHIAGETKKVGEVVDRRFDTLQITLQEVADFMAAQRATNTAVDARLAQLGSAIDGADARRASDVDALQKETQQLSAAVSKGLEHSAITLRESEARQAAQMDALRTESTQLIGSVEQKLDSAVAAQQERNARHSAALEALDRETKAISASMSEKIDQIFQELGIHQEDIAAMKETLVSFSTRVQGLAERLDRQADAVRSMCSAYSQREMELEQLVSGLARLRSFPTPMPANAL